MTGCVMCCKWDDDTDLRVAELEHCYVLLNRDQFFAGYCFVFTKNHVTELFHLDTALRGAIVEEVTLVAEAVFNAFQPAKINYELLGNMVPHMHWHIVPRFRDDPLWPRPIWSEQHEPAHLAPAHAASRIALIRSNLRTQ